jgi:hypothetical protein
VERSGGPPRSAAAERAEQFLARVLPGLDDEPAGAARPARAARPAGVDAATQARLEAMGAPERESW